MIEKAFHLTDHHRLVADVIDEPEQVHRHARLVAVRVGDDDPSLVRIHLENGTDARIHLGAHQDHVLAVLDRLEGDLGADLAVAGGFDDGIDLPCLAYEQRIVRHRKLALLDALLEIRNAGDADRVLYPAVAIGALRLRERAIGNRDELHTARRGENLKCTRAGGESCAHEGYTNRFVLGRTFGQSCIDNLHCLTSLRRNLGRNLGRNRATIDRQQRRP